MRTLRAIPLALGAVLGLVLLGAGGWVFTPARPEPDALAALVPGADVAVDLNPWIAFLPGHPRETGFILYPGARVDPRVYARAARAIAEHGYPTLIVPMPLNLALLAPEQGLDVIGSFPQVKRWAIGGHSLGGAMAARFALNHPHVIHGLVLWASRPAGTDDLSGLAIPVASIYGTEDGLVDPQTIAHSQALLPPDTTFVAIAGGNHAQFGNYPPQLGSGEASISADEQQAQIVLATLALLSEIEAAEP
jgi:pimeloyl-ACP methyl ester carboxylesterase